ncbi:hypothetical protein [Flavobacterium sp.]|uniref:hypothetical protein n=1 Tax=Flavobacterium sp. TaxID=239 RepID=UPI00391D5095
MAHFELEDFFLHLSHNSIQRLIADFSNLPENFKINEVVIRDGQSGKILKKFKTKKQYHAYLKKQLSKDLLNSNLKIKLNGLDLSQKSNV